MTRQQNGRSQLLVRSHPSLGPQFLTAVLAPGERPRDAALAAMARHCGVQASAATTLASSEEIADGEVWHLLDITTDALPDSWTAGGDGAPFRYVWHDLDAPLDSQWPPVLHTALAVIREARQAIALPAHMAGSGALDRLVDTAHDYARQAASENTLKAYGQDWAQYGRWCRLRGVQALPPSPELIGLYLADLAAPQGNAPARLVSTIERRLSGLVWAFRQRGFEIDRKDRHIASVLAGIKRKHARPPVQKEAILPEEIIAMVATLPYDLRGLRDRAILLMGYAGGLRRSEIVGLDHGKDDTPDSTGWVSIMEDGAVLTLQGKTGWREVEIGRGSSDRTCPVAALEQWLHFARIGFGPLFRRTSRDNRKVLDARLSDKHVARLIKQTVLAAGIRPELSEADRVALFSGHSLRAGLASSAEVDEWFVQKHLGHASVEMTRRYQRRRDRFRVNLTKAAGL